MKHLILLTIFGLFQPRYYMEALATKRRYLFGIALISIFAYTIGNFAYIQPMTQQISHDLKAVTQYLPPYKMENHTLSLPAGTQPVYYSSSFIQVVVDDQLNADTLSKDSAKLEQFNNDIPFLMLLTQEEGMLRINHHSMAFNTIHAANMSSEEFKTIFEKMSKMVPMATLSSSFILSIFQYTLFMLLITALSSFFNRRLSQPLHFKLRLRLVIVTAFIPSLLLNTLGLFFPLLKDSPLPLAGMTLFTMFCMLMEHTKFIKDNLPKE